ncbi:MAG TPA: N-acetylmuramoyl-L-alanine amidase [Draconibacterium sp.]|nr:N-acetylmuramoyl-L-alanine amidase [Draconibacterium sp.]
MSEQVRKYMTVVLLAGMFLLSFIISDHSAIEKKNGQISVVVIDPGHGGKDPGTVGGTLEEKTVVLDIALRLGEYIRVNYPDIKVIFTRKSDVFIPLNKRAEIANKADADLFISIHANAVNQKVVQGTETFVLGQHRSEDNLEVAKKENSVILLEDDYTSTYEGFDPNSPESYIMFELVQDEYKEQSISLANEIQNEFRLKALRKDRSVKEAGFLVLRQTTMPGVLIETGFLSNPGERQYLSSESGRDYLAAAIFRAFQKYKTDVEQKSSFHIVSNTPDEEASTPPAKNKISSETSSISEKEKTETDLYYSVQIMALKKKLEPTAENFKGLENVFRVDAKDYSRYFCGKFQKLKDAENQQQLILSHYPSAFVVAFQNNQLISVKKVPEE